MVSTLQANPQGETWNICLQDYYKIFLESLFKSFIPIRRAQPPPSLASVVTRDFHLFVQTERLRAHTSSRG